MCVIQGQASLLHLIVTQGGHQYATGVEMFRRVAKSFARNSIHVRWCLQHESDARAVVLHDRLVGPVIDTSTHAPTHSPNAVMVYAISDLRSDLGYG